MNYNIEDIHRKFLSCSGVSIDSRKVKQNDLFVCLKGANFDANEFASIAIQKGASFVIVDNEVYHEPTDKRYILVKDALKTLQELAKFHRVFTGVQIIALTGSNGKTTTKELIHTVLKTKYKTIATIGNLNNDIGVPLTLLRIQKDTEVAVVEMGANHQKEIAFLCDLIKPDYGYITNFGKAHLEGFGGVEGVVKGKSELYDYLRTQHKKAFVLIDDTIQKERSEGISRVLFSIENNSQAKYLFDVNSSNEFITVDYDNHSIRTNLVGVYNGINVSAAISIGLVFGVAIEDIKKAIEQYIPDNNRSQWVKKGSNEILLDAYNANPSSMILAINSFSKLEKKNKQMILGDMYELGEYAFEEHKKIVSLADKLKIKTHFIGNLFYEHKKESDYLFFYERLADFLEEIDLESMSYQTILIKASRGMALEQIMKK